MYLPANSNMPNTRTPTRTSQLLCANLCVPHVIRMRYTNKRKRLEEHRRSWRSSSQKVCITPQWSKGFYNRARLGLARAYAYINGFKHSNKTHIPDISRNCRYRLFSLCLCLRFFYVRVKIPSLFAQNSLIFLPALKKNKRYTCKNTNVTTCVCVMVCVLLMFLFICFFTCSPK